MTVKPTKNNPTLHIAGVGPIGCLFSSLFFNSGQDVRLILKNKTQVIGYQQSKITVSIEQNIWTAQPSAISLDDIGDAPIHYLLCCVKSYDITQLLLRLKNNLNEKSMIILNHNGMGVLDEIKKNLPQLRVISGVNTHGAYFETPFTVRAFLTGIVYLGAAIGQYTADEVEMVCNDFTNAKIPYQWVDNILPFMWDKFALNCSINLLTVLFKCKNGDIRQYPDLLKQLTQEIAEVLNAHGISLSSMDLFERVMELCKQTADNYSSTYQDIQNNKPTELSYLNEYLVTLAKQYQIPTPLTIELLEKFYSRS